MTGYRKAALFVGTALTVALFFWEVVQEEWGAVVVAGLLVLINIYQLGSPRSTP